MGHTATRRVYRVAAVTGSILFLLAADRALKAFAQRVLYNRKIDVLGEYLQLEFYHNERIAFSIPLPEALVVPLVSAAVIILLFVLARNARRQRGAPEALLAFIVAGAMSNLYDRLRFGYVVDYISIGFFPVFNLADGMISIGAIALVALLYRQSRGADGA